MSGRARTVGLRTFALVYLLFLLSFGVGYIATTPPFEGFDETAHYSSLLEIADTGRIPVYGRSYLAKSVVDYQGPVPYGTGTPPFDRGLVYPKFFAQPDLVAQYLEHYRTPAPHAPFQPGNPLNWQAQHAPLYYVLVANLVPVLDRFSFSTQIFLLRLTSYGLALGGVAFALLAVARLPDSPQRNAALLGFVLYPILLPMFFPAFARIGNDSLCLFFSGAMAYLLAAWLKDERDVKTAVGIGAALGLGLLTKAFFVPIAVALGIFLGVRLLLDKANPVPKSTRLKNSAYLFLVAFLIGGGWYVYKLLAYGDLTGADEAIRLSREGGLVAGLERHFSLFQLLRGIVMPLASYQWTGTWSVTRLPEILQVPMGALAAWVAIAYLIQAKDRPLADPAWLPVWLFALFYLGLLWHVLYYLALSGIGATGGWYLHILLPWIAPAIGLSFVRIVARRWTRPLVVALFVYAFAFHAFALWAQLSLFTGCATKGADKHYVFSGNALCFDQAPLIVDRLGVLGYPALAACAACLGLVCLAWLIVQTRRGIEV